MDESDSNRSQDARTGPADATWAMLEGAFAQSRSAMVLASVPDGRIRVVNRALIGILGIEDEPDPTGLCVFDLHPSWTLEDATGRVLRWEEHPIILAVQGHPTSHAEMLLTRKDGQRRILDVDAVCIRGGNGDVIAALVTFADVTEARNTTRLLAEREAQYRILVQQAADAILVGGPGGEILEASDRATPLTGYTREELIGQNIAILFLPEALATHPLRYDLLDRGEMVARERTLQRKDGTQISIEMDTVRVPDGRYQAILRDVTERKRVAAEARQTLHYFQSLERVSRIASRTLDLDETLRGVLESFLDIFHCDRVFLLHPCVPTQPTWHIEIEVDRPGCEAGLQGFDVPFNDPIRDVVRHILQADGPVLLDPRDLDFGVGLPAPEVQAVLMSAVGPDGPDPCMIGMHWCHATHVPGEHQYTLLRDLSRRLGDLLALWRMHRDLAASEDRYRQLFTRMSTGFCLAALAEGKGGLADLRIVEANPAFERLCGTPSVPLVGALAADVLDDRELPWTQAAREALVGRSTQAEHRGAVTGRWFRIAAYPPRPGQVALLVEDITHERLAEQEMQKANRLESIGLLAGGIAHDFNNILTGILGSLSLGRMHTTDPSLAELLEGAEKASLRARDLTNQLLTFAKGGEPIRKKTTTLEGLLRDSATFALSGSRCTCSFVVQKDLWPVEVDDSQISRVFQNLVINASQAMPGGGDIRVRAANHDETAGLGLLAPGRYVAIAIEDQGHGIAPEDVPRIFDPYFTTREGGSGFGLAITYSIVRRHGGVIEVQSTPGQGSTFTVYLPASQDEPALQASGGAEAVTSGRGRILVMDDEEIVREFLLRALPSLGYEVDAVADGAAAIDRYRAEMAGERPFDLVIMDLTVAGGLGGLEATAQLRALDPQARVLVSSGYSTDPVMSDHRRFGFCGVLDKPYRMDRLSQTLAQALARRSGG